MKCNFFIILGNELPKCAVAIQNSFSFQCWTQVACMALSTTIILRRKNSWGIAWTEEIEFQRNIYKMCSKNTPRIPNDQTGTSQGMSDSLLLKWLVPKTNNNAFHHKGLANYGEGAIQWWQGASQQQEELVNDDEGAGDSFLANENKK